MCTRVSEVVLAAAAARRAESLSGPEVLARSSQLPALAHDEASTRWGNVLQILDQGARSHSDWLLLGAAVAIYVGATWQRLDRSRVIVDGAWLAAETPCNPWLFLDACLDDAAEFWLEVGERFLALPHPQQLALAAGLSSARSNAALELKRRVLTHTESPTLAQLLESSTPVSRISAELGRAPQKAWLLVLQALSGWLLVSSLVRAVGRHLLLRRRKGTLEIDARGLCLREEHSVLGQTLGHRERWIPLDQLGVLSRETRFAGLGLYTGLFTLVVGSYLGVRLFVDGVRVPGGSPSLVGFGLGLVAVAIAIDALLNGFGGATSGKTRLLVQHKQGQSFALGPLPSREVDAWLEQVGVLRAFGGPRSS
jgi:hypothetical protein